MINLKELLDKISEISDPKVQTLCSFICSKIWCYGDLVWDTHLPDLDIQLQVFSNQELIDLGNKLVEIKSRETQILFAWLISKSNRLTDLVLSENLSPEEEQNRNVLKGKIASKITMLHTIEKCCDKIPLLQETLQAVNAMKSNLETQQLAQKLLDKIESLSP